MIENDQDNHIEINLIDFQILLSLLFIGTIAISILSGMNEKFNYQKKKPLFKEKTANQISLYNRLIVFILPSILAVIASFILLYSIYVAQKRNPSELTVVENPIV